MSGRAAAAKSVGGKLAAIDDMVGRFPALDLIVIESGATDPAATAGAFLAPFLLAGLVGFALSRLDTLISGRPARDH